MSATSLPGGAAPDTSVSSTLEVVGAFLTFTGTEYPMDCHANDAGWNDSAAAALSIGTSTT